MYGKEWELFTELDDSRVVGSKEKSEKRLLYVFYGGGGAGMKSAHCSHDPGSHQAIIN